MRRALAVLVLLALAPLGVAAEKTVDGTLLDRAVIEPAAFDSVKRLERYVSREDHAKIAAEKGWVLERIGYASDGLRVTAWVYRPTGEVSKPLPVVIFNRGGYTAVEHPDMFRPMFHRFARAGFITVAPMLRESDGGEGKDKVGGDDVHDLMNVIPLLKHLPSADRDRLFLYGHSRGGMMSYRALSEGFPARAAASLGGFTDLGALISEHPEQYNPLLPVVWPEWEQEKDEIIRKRSAVQWPERIGKPVLIMHGGADRLNPLHALRLA